MSLKRTMCALLAASMMTTGFAALQGTASAATVENESGAEVTTEESGANYGLATSIENGNILHCFNWKLSDIKAELPNIAAAGYTSVQTSPVQQPKDYYWEGVAYGNVGIPDGTGGYEGNWWKAYQPVTFSICDNGHIWYGTKAEFKEMCAEAEKYGVKVIVDIVANHMGNIQGWKIGDAETVMGDISP